MRKLLTLLLFLPVFVQGQIITTFAGNGGIGYTGDGGQATAAEFNLPHSVSFDPAGNVYVADVNNNCIRKISPSGIITTVAGTGIAGFSGDGSAATLAQLNQPFYAKMDPSGNLIIGDQANYRVRKVDPSGIITTIAGNGTLGFSGDGGPATAALLHSPCGIAFDASGNVYFADLYNNCVREINVTTGIVSLVAGTTAIGYSGDGGPATLAKLYYCNYLNTDAAGNLYIADNGNHCIRKVNTSGIISTVAGTGTAGYGADGIPATSSALNYPGGMGFDATGNMYLADDINHRVRMVTPAGLIYTTVGTGTAGFGGDGGPATAAQLNTVVDVDVNSAGALFIADMYNYRIREVSICAVDTISGPTYICPGGTVSFSDATLGGTWSVSNTSIGTINSSGTYTSTTYPYFFTGDTITYSISGGCKATKIVNIGSVPSGVLGNLITGDSTVCVGATTTLSCYYSSGLWISSNTAVATITSGTGIVSGVSPGISFIEFSPAIYAPYTCYRINSLETVVAPPGPIIESIYPCTGNFSAISDAVAGGTWSSSNTNVATIASNTLQAGTVPGTVVIAYSNICGTSSQTLTINSRPMTLPGITTDPLYLCLGSTITLSNDGTPVGTWSSSNTAVATINSVTGFLAGTGIGGSTLITASNLCGGENETVIFSSPGTITGVTTFCQGATTTLSDTVASGTWSSGSPGIATVTLNTGIVTGVTPGTAIITYTISGGCFTTATVTVEPSPVGITGYTNACTGATTTLSDSPAGGTWSSGATGVATISGTGVVSGVTPGTTTITYTLTGDCFTTTTVTVYQSPSAISGATSVCTGSSITLSDAVGGGTWSSSNAGKATVTPGGGAVSGVAAGAVIITYTTGGSCFATYSVTVNLTPTVTTGSPNICTDGTTLLTGTPAGGTWSSSNTAAATIHIGTGSDTVAGVFSGNTVITYTLAGCSASATVTVVAVLPGITGPSQVCTGQSIALNNTITGGTWSSANTTIATVDPAAGVVTGVSVGDTVISYTIGGSCITTTTVMVNLSPNPGAITGPSAICVGTTLTWSDTASGGVWGLSNGNATISGDSVTGVFAGADTITYTTNSLYCGTATTTAVITITLPPDAGTITGDTSACAGTPITLSDAATGGVWSSSNNTVATVSGGTGIVHTITAGTDTIRYAVTNACNTATATQLIIVYPIPAISPITGQDSVCSNAVFTLSDATAGGVWSATNPTVLSINDTGEVSAFAAGISIISYTETANPGDCISVQTFTVTVSAHGTYTVSSAITPVTCYGASNGSIFVTVSNGGAETYQYLWNNGVNGPSLTGLPPGYDTVNIKAEATQCSEIVPIFVPGPDSLDITATATADTCDADKGTVSIAVTGGTTPYTYMWSNSKTEKDITGLLSGSYSVTVTDSNGCTKSITATVNEDTCNNIIIHNIITPNGDGINDTWVIEGLYLYPDNSVQIFDKWGDEVYEKTNYQNDWGGRGKSGELPDGTYYYLVKLNANNLKGGGNVWTGYLMIKR